MFKLIIFISYEMYKYSQKENNEQKRQKLKNISFTLEYKSQFTYNNFKSFTLFFNFYEND